MADNLHVHEGSAADPLLRTKDTGAGHLSITLAGQHIRTNISVQTLVLTSSSQLLTVPSGATHADIMAESTSATDYCRFWDGGGTNPTASVGMKLGPGAPSGSFWETASPGTFKAINSSGSCTLQICYFKYL